MDQRLAVEVTNLDAVYLSRRPFEHQTYIDFVIPYRVNAFMRNAMRNHLSQYRGVSVMDGVRRPRSHLQFDQLLLNWIVVIALFGVLDCIFQNVYARVFAAFLSYAMVWYFEVDFTSKLVCLLVAVKVLFECVKMGIALVFDLVGMFHVFEGAAGVAVYQLPPVFPRILGFTLIVLFCIYKMLH